MPCAGGRAQQLCCAVRWWRGCGTAARLDFKGHSRPATPVDVSVYLGGGKPLVDPQRVEPGPVLFNVTNQTVKPQTVSVAAP